MIWITKEIQTLSKKIEILPKIASDHNPILWTGKGAYRQFNRRINEDLLTRQENIVFLKREINEYFKNNINKGTNTQIVWEAHKAVMRGNLMSVNGKDKRQKYKKLEDLQNTIKQKEEQLKKHPGKKSIMQEIRVLQQQIENFTNYETCWALKRVQQKAFEGANKAGKYLAWHLEKKGEHKTITRIRDDDKDCTDQRTIKRAFYKFYVKLLQKVLLIRLKWKRIWIKITCRRFRKNI